MVFGIFDRDAWIVLRETSTLAWFEIGMLLGLFPSHVKHKAYH